MNDIVARVMSEVYSTIIWGITPNIEGITKEEKNFHAGEALAKLAGDIVLDMVDNGELNQFEAIEACNEIGLYINKTIFSED